MRWAISMKYTNFSEIESVYKLPLSGASIIDPSKAVLLTGGNQRYWVGGMCYSRKYVTTRERFVVVDSLIEDRIPFAQEVISYFDNLVTYDSRKEITLKGLFRSCYNFVAWCDENGHCLLYT